MIKIENKIGAKFKAVVKKNGEVVRESGWSSNLVLDSGLNRMSVGTWISRCCVGSGNSTPNAGQTMLDSLIASTTAFKNQTPVSNTSTSPIYYGMRLTWDFSTGIAAGNISEVGLGWATTSLWNRALIRDISGNPTTITVLIDETLEIIAEVRCYPAELSSGTFDLVDKNNVLISTHTYQCLPVISSVSMSIFDKVELGYNGSANANYTCTVSTEAMGSSVTSRPNTTESQAANANTTTYPTTTSAKAICTFPPAKVNFAHRTLFLRNSIMAGTGIGYKLEISPPITKNNTESMVYDFVLSWGRYVAT